MTKALIIIDVQKDYFASGAYPQFKADSVLPPIKQAIEQTKTQGELVVFIKHESPAGFLIKGTEGSEIHDKLVPYMSDTVTIIKTHADSFLDTNLDEILQQHNISEILLTGIMTQNCITHTSISKYADKYKVTIVANTCTAPTEMIHKIALKALSDRVNIVESL